jgi:hypothetical protein
VHIRFNFSISFRLLVVRLIQKSLQRVLIGFKNGRDGKSLIVGYEKGVGNDRLRVEWKFRCLI